jgi:ParB family chromosome partitioning protein
MKIERVLVQAITVSVGHRKVDPAIVDSLAESIGRLGLLSPILVRVFKEEDEMVHLIAGRHRLEAAKRLGWNLIDAFCFTGDDAEARMREIAENLHRSELTVLERSEQIEEWRVLAEEADKGKPQVGVNLGGRPSRGKKTTATELGVSEQAVERAEKIASITPAAKDAAKEAGIDDNQSKLLKVAAAEPEKQVEAVKEAAKKERAKRQAAAQKAADTKRRKREAERRKQEARAKARGEERNRELEVIRREMDALASQLIALDRDVAHAVYKVVIGDWDRSRQFEFALEEGLRLIKDEPDETTDTDTTTDRWIDGDDLGEAAA